MWQLTGFRIGAKRFQNSAGISDRGKEISNRGKGNYKPGQGFQIGVGIINRCRTTFSLRCVKIGSFLSFLQNRITVSLEDLEKKRRRKEIDNCCFIGEGFSLEHLR